jgi:2-dehydropantoate 2-reductase
MKVAVIGAGAMGSLFGALLAEGGAEVTLLDLREDHVDAVRRNGLQIEDRDGRTRTVPLSATVQAGEVGRVELALIFVKATHTPSAAATAAAVVERTGTVLTLQNGMGNAETIAAAVAPEQIVAGTTSHGATLLGAGRIRHAGSGSTIIGAWTAGEAGRARSDGLAEFFATAGIETQSVADVHAVLWEKLMVNVGINAITALTGIRNGELLDLDATRHISRAAVEEASRVAAAREIEIRPDIIAHVFKIATATGPNRSSMGQDVDHRRTTEITAINGFIVKAAEELGIQVPVNRTLTALVETLQAHY